VLIRSLWLELCDCNLDVIWVPNKCLPMESGGDEDLSFWWDVWFLNKLILVLWDPTHVKVSCVCELRTADFQARCELLLKTEIKVFLYSSMSSGLEVHRWPGQRINHSYVNVSIVLIHLVKLFDIKWHVCIHSYNWCAPVILNWSLLPPHWSISCQVVGINPAEDMIVSSSTV
jgi:hypothetical protein